MISFIKGKVFEIKPTYVVIDNNDIGYTVRISLNTYSKINPDEPIFLHTEQIIRDDAHLLYGFFEQLERELFKLLISVSGIGANTALLILSAMTAQDVQKVIAGSNVSALQAVKGIGAKTAQRAIIELKDKIIKTYNLETTASSGKVSTTKKEAVSALESLGYPRKRSEKIIDTLLKENQEISLENTIKEALKRF